NLDQQRTRAPHFFLQQPGGGVLTLRLQRIRADQFREAVRLVRRSRAHRPHFVELDGDAAPGTLPCRFRSRQASPDDSYFFHCTQVFIRLRRASPNLFIIWGTRGERIPWPASV